MQQLARVLGLARASGPEAMFDALCRVHDGAQSGDDAQQRLVRLVQELGVGERSEAPTDARPSSALPALPVVPSAPMEATTPAARQDALVESLMRTLASYRELLDRHHRDFDDALARRDAGVEDDVDETTRRLREAQAVLVKYPIAAQAAFAALVREGRRFATTPEGERWKRRLASSPALAKARTMFEGLANGMVVEDGGPLASAFVDAFVRAMDRGLEDVLATVGGVAPR